MFRFQLSTHVIQLLESYGWNEDRKIDIRKIEQFLLDKNIEISPVARDFLQTFAGLSFILPHGGLSAIIFDVREELKFINRDELAQLESVVGSKLCPVGYGGRFLVFITPAEEMIFLHDEWLVCLRVRNVCDAFEHIYSIDFKDYETIELTDSQKPVGFRDVD